MTGTVDTVCMFVCLSVCLFANVNTAHVSSQSDHVFCSLSLLSENGCQGRRRRFERWAKCKIDERSSGKQNYCTLTFLDVIEAKLRKVYTET